MRIMATFLALLCCAGFLAAEDVAPPPVQVDRTDQQAVATAFWEATKRGDLDLMWSYVAPDEDRQVFDKEFTRVRKEWPPAPAELEVVIDTDGDTGHGTAVNWVPKANVEMKRVDGKWYMCK